MAFSGIRIRVRRLRDDYVLFDSGGPVTNLSELLIDGLSGYVGSEGYSIDGLYTQGDGSPVNPFPSAPQARRQTMVCLALHK